MSLLDHAKTELNAIGVTDDGDINGWMRNDILQLVETFANQGHSGMSASYAISILTKLLSYEPLCPLTGNDDEWMEVSTNLYQNKRCSRVFKENGIPYDIDGKVFEEPDGFRYTSKDSRVNITFPYTPKTEIVQVPERDE